MKLRRFVIGAEHIRLRYMLGYFSKFNGLIPGADFFVSGLVRYGLGAPVAR